MAELLLGCGNSRAKQFPIDGKPDWSCLVTMDHDPNCGADIEHDLEQTPWPLGDDAFREVHAYEVLEHLGAQGDYKAFFAHFGEIWRILEPGGHLVATVPAIESPWLWGDPSHRRAITLESLTFLDQAAYAQVGKSPMTDFRWLWRGDLECVGAVTKAGQFRFVLKAHKPARSVDG